jgi:hypothetical protein
LIGTPAQYKPVTTEDLRTGLAEALDAGVLGVVRAPCPYQSSFSLEKLEVTLVDGRELRMMFKDIGSQGKSVKPHFVYNPQREIRTYAEVLSLLDIGTPTFYGSVIDRQIGRYWLFIEDVPGVELYQVGDLNTWQAVGRWLASFHERSVGTARTPGLAVPLLFYSEEYCNTWMRRAEQFFGNACSQHGRMTDLTRKFERVVERIGSLPVTLIHGEFYASNILVDSTRDILRICPVDWEMTAIGPAAIDLAALTSGRWTEIERRSIVNAYISGRSDCGKEFDVELFLYDLDCCRFYIAVQWLGWFGHNVPYEAHKQDWLGEAFRLAGRIA